MTQVPIKSPQAIAAMEKGGQALGKILHKLFGLVTVGTTPVEIESKAQELIRRAGATPSFATVGNYRWATCININDEVVHAIPSNERFLSGDVVTIDIGMCRDGYHTDTSWSGAIAKNSTVSPRVKKFLQAGQQALNAGIAQARAGNRIGHISQAIQAAIKGAGYNLVPHLVGHGIGKLLHEPPHVPNVVSKPLDKTLQLKKGMTIAIEPIYVEKNPETVKDADGWTIRTRDKGLGASFEHTVLITDSAPHVLTKWS